MKIFGHVDLCGPELIEGWLYCDNWEGGAIKMQVFLGDSLVGECVADQFRADLQDAGFGDGRCAFSFQVPETLASARFVDTKLRLIDTPVFLLPDESSNIAVAGAPAGAEEGQDYLADKHAELSATETRDVPPKRSSLRSLQHTP